MVLITKKTHQFYFVILPFPARLACKHELTILKCGRSVSIPGRLICFIAFITIWLSHTHP